MIYTVTFNPSLDYIVSVEQLMPHAVNRTISEQIQPGGKGINVSMVLKNLGHETKALGFIAGFTGEEMMRRLEEQGIPSDFIWVENGMTRINVKLCESRIDDEKKEETEINGNGPIISEADIMRLLQKIENDCSREDILVLSGSISKGVSSDIYGQILKRCTSKDIPVVVDATGELLWKTLLQRPFLVKPNIHELEEMFDCHIEQEKDVWFYAEKLQQEGARNVLVSMGAKGALLLTEDHKQYQCIAPKREAVNAVGAGDSMVAGFLAGYLEYQGDYEAALKMAVCTGSASAFSKELATREEVLTLCRLMDFKN